MHKTHQRWFTRTRLVGNSTRVQCAPSFLHLFTNDIKLSFSRFFSFSDVKRPKNGKRSVKPPTASCWAFKPKPWPKATWAKVPLPPQGLVIRPWAPYRTCSLGLVPTAPPSRPSPNLCVEKTWTKKQSAIEKLTCCWLWNGPYFDWTRKVVWSVNV